MVTLFKLKLNRVCCALKLSLQQELQNLLFPELKVAPCIQPLKRKTNSRFISSCLLHSGEKKGKSEVDLRKNCYKCYFQNQKHEQETKGSSL